MGATTRDLSFFVPVETISPPRVVSLVVTRRERHGEQYEGARGRRQGLRLDFLPLPAVSRWYWLRRTRITLGKLLNRPASAALPQRLLSMAPMHVDLKLRHLALHHLRAFDAQEPCDASVLEAHAGAVFLSPR